MANGGDYTGTIFPPFPPEVKRLTGAVLDYDVGNEVEWSVHLVEIGGEKYLWLSSFESREQQKAYFKVRHQLLLPKIKNNEYVYVTLCKSHKSDEVNITGIGNGDPDEEWHNNITAAYKLNLNAAKLEPINPIGVSCYNEGYGV